MCSYCLVLGGENLAWQQPVLSLSLVGLYGCHALYQAQLPFRLADCATAHPIQPLWILFAGWSW